MDAVNYTELRRNLKDRMDQVCENHEPLIVTRKNNQNLVLLSLEDYNSLIETHYLLSSAKNEEHIMKSIASAKAGDLIEKDLEDL